MAKSKCCWQSINAFFLSFVFEIIYGRHTFNQVGCRSILKWLNGTYFLFNFLSKTICYYIFFQPKCHYWKLCPLCWLGIFWACHPALVFAFSILSIQLWVLVVWNVEWMQWTPKISSWLSWTVAQRREKKNYKHLCLAFVIVFWLNTLHWLAWWIFQLNYLTGYIILWFIT